MSARPQDPLPVRACDDGVIVSVRLTPKSSRDAIEGSGMHGEMPVLKARVRAAPEKGRANTALEHLLAKWMGVPRSCVSLRTGNKARLKTVQISGDPVALKATVQARLEGTETA